MTSPLSVPRRHARLGRYTLWQISDFALHVGGLMLILFILLGYTFIMSIHAMEGYGATVPLGKKLQEFNGLLAMFASVAPLLSVSGIVSNDRVQGYTRFLFAKPVSPLALYGQSYVTRFIGTVVLGLMLAWWWSLLQPPAVSWRLAADIAGIFVAVSGVIFFLSVVTRFDGAITVVFLLVSGIIWIKWEKTDGILHWLTYLVPPVTKYGDIHAWTLQLNVLGNTASVPFPATFYWWNVGYGAAAFALGLLLLRRMPLTKG